MKATKIRMNNGKDNSNECIDIKDIYIIDCNIPGWYPKAGVYNAIKNNGETVVVNRNPFPKLVPCLSENGEKFVKSEPDEFKRDNLLSLPREK